MTMGQGRETGKAPLADSDDEQTSARQIDLPRPFEILLRGLHQTDLDGKIITAPTVAEAVADALAADVGSIVEPILVWKDEDKLVALDFDRPDGAEPLVDADVDGFITPNAPTPAAAWVTHGGGLRVLFHEFDTVSAVALAGTWLLLAPLGDLRTWSLEVKTDSRHPLGLRDGASCGRVFTFSPTSNVDLRGGSDG